jgi:hypothetical protein
MDKIYLFVDELTPISKRLQRVFDRNADGAAADISFKAVQEFRKQIQSWHREFVKPPMSLVSTCDLERLAGFYRHRLDFSIFQRFPSADFEVIQEEISAHAAREALDSLFGYRLRNWASIGLQHPKWQRYQELVGDYYAQTVSPEKQERIAAFSRMLARRTDRPSAEIHAKCAGELFFEVDRIRLMPMRSLEQYLERLRLQEIGGKQSQEWEDTRLSNMPEGLQASFQLFGFTDSIDANALKARYRQLALDYHPDKGGNLEMMQRLNAAYLEIANYLRRL